MEELPPKLAPRKTRLNQLPRNIFVDLANVLHLRFHLCNLSRPKRNTLGLIAYRESPLGSLMLAARISSENHHSLKSNLVVPVAVGAMSMHVKAP